MASLSERASAPRRPLPALVLAAVLACLATVSRAQAPSCAWGDGVALPGGDTRDVLIASDGAAGLLAITWRVNIGTTYVSTLRLHHVMEQGRLDPAMPADGVVIMSASLVPDRPEYTGVRAVPDDAGGAYVLLRACISTLAHLRCWEVAEMRLLHVTGQGTTVPGWPAAGRVLDARGSPDPRDVVDIVPDGAGGVIAAWVDTANYVIQSPPVRAQRFAADGTMLWPGGLDGLDVLSPQTLRFKLKVAGDGAGGCVVVTSQLVQGSATRNELKAGRVDETGGLPWTSVGKVVMTQPTSSADVQALAVDAVGRSFVTAVLTPVSPGQSRFCTNLLSSLGARLWTLAGVDLGATNGASGPAFATPVGFLSVHGNVDGTPWLQLQEDTGYPYWGGVPDGIAADWVDTPPSHRPLVTPEGHVISLWQSSAPPPTQVRGIELDESGATLEGWPSPWAVVCGDNIGRILLDALVSGPHVFAAWSSDELSGVEPLVQRLTRAVLGVDDTRPTSALELGSPMPNPTRGAWSATVSVRDASDATLEVFDIAGRRVLERELGVLAPGRHVLKAETGGSLAPGVYRVRVRAGVRSAERVLVRLR